MSKWLIFSCNPSLKRTYKTRYVCSRTITKRRKRMHAKLNKSIRIDEENILHFHRNKNFPMRYCKKKTRPCANRPYKLASAKTKRVIFYLKQKKDGKNVHSQECNEWLARPCLTRWLPVDSLRFSLLPSHHQRCRLDKTNWNISKMMIFKRFSGGR